MIWWNYLTSQSDTRAPETDEIAREYIPQIDAAQNIYNLYREAGLPILQAMINVLLAYNGEPAAFPINGG